MSTIDRGRVQLAKEKRQEELDVYEARFGKYVEENGPFGMMGLRVGNQGFPIFWEDDPEMTNEQNAEGRRWFKRMLCNALHELVKMETTTPTEQ